MTRLLENKLKQTEEGPVMTVGELRIWLDKIAEDGRINEDTQIRFQVIGPRSGAGRPHQRQELMLVDYEATEGPSRYSGGHTHVRTFGTDGERQEFIEHRQYLTEMCPDEPEFNHYNVEAGWYRKGDSYTSRNFLCYYTPTPDEVAKDRRTVDAEDRECEDYPVQAGDIWFYVIHNDEDEAYKFWPNRSE